jgi:hypothetical protein
VSAILALGGLVVLTALAVIQGALGDMARKEAQTRLSRIPRGLIRIALARVPEDLRDDLASEWTSELDFVLTGTEELPLTALWRGIRFAAGLLGSSGEIAARLKGIPARNAALSAGRIAYGLITALIGVQGIAGLITEYLHLQITALQLSAATLMALSWATGGLLTACRKYLASWAVAFPLACAANIGFYIVKPGAFHLTNAIIFFTISAGLAAWKVSEFRRQRVLRLAWSIHGEMYPDCSDCPIADLPTSELRAYNHVMRSAEPGKKDSG